MQSVDMADEGLARLANEVRARRKQLGLTQGALASRGGPGVVTVGKIERAEINAPDPSTLRGLDRALMWAPTSAAAVLTGGEPTILTGSGPAGAGIITAIENEPSLLPEARAHLINQLELLLRLAPDEPAMAAVQEQRRRKALAEVPTDLAEQVAETAAMEAKLRNRKRTPAKSGKPTKIVPESRR